MLLSYLNKKLDKNGSFAVLFAIIFSILSGIFIGINFGIYNGAFTGALTGLLSGMIILYGTCEFECEIFPLFPFLISVSVLFPLGIFIVPLWILGIAFFAIVELIFWYGEEKPKPKENKLWFACKIKLKSIVDTVFIFILLNLVFGLIAFIINNIVVILEVLKWVGIVAGVILGIIGYFAVNSLKYRNNKDNDKIKKKVKRKK